jgi:hypothetical protein
MRQQQPDLSAIWSSTIASLCPSGRRSSMTGGRLTSAFLARPMSALTCVQRLFSPLGMRSATRIVVTLFRLRLPTSTSLCLFGLYAANAATSAALIKLCKKMYCSASEKVSKLMTKWASSRILVSGTLLFSRKQVPVIQACPSVSRA